MTHPLIEVRKAERWTYSISAGGHVFFGVVIVLDQFGSELIQSLETTEGESEFYLITARV